MSRPPLPPFTAETAAQKTRMAEDAWNTRDPARVALAYSADSRWRNRSEFLQGLLRHGFNGRDRADRHEDGRLNLSMRREKPPAAGLVVCL